MKISLKIAICGLCLMLYSCSMTKVIPENKSMLVSNELEFNGKRPDDLSDISDYIKQTPKSGIFGFLVPVAIYNTGNGSGKGWDKIAKTMGTPPLIFEKDLVKSSASNMLNHMKYKGFYKSDITYDIKTEKKKTKVKYFITPGKRYVIDTITYTIPDVNMYDILTANQANSLVKPGHILSEDRLEKESERMADTIRPAIFGEGVTPCS